MKTFDFAILALIAGFIIIVGFAEPDNKTPVKYHGLTDVEQAKLQKAMEKYGY